MKRRFTQKVKQVPSCAADSFDALLKLYLRKQPVGAVAPTDVNRRACTSAATIGLALSISAAGLLLPQQSDEAMAFEPVAAEPNSPSVTVEPSTSVSAGTQETAGVAQSTPPMSLQQEVAANVKAPQLPVVEHQVREGETLWELSKSYEVQPEAIAASNNIQPSAVLPVGQTLKIPTANGIVHKVKPGDTVEKLSKSYGVEPTQLQASVAVSESGELQAGESVTVPGNVNDLLKARQDVALNNLKKQRNRLNDSLAELRSEESINQSELATEATEVASAAAPTPSVTLPPGVLKPKEQVANAPKPAESVSTSPVTIPVPTPEVAISPIVVPSADRRRESSVAIPVPTPEVAISPIIVPSAIKRSEPSTVIPVPTPEATVSPTVVPSAVKRPESSTVMPVPTPNLAVSPTVVPSAVKRSELPIVIPVPTPDATVSPTIVPPAAKPRVPQPVVMQTLTTGTANVYQVKPGDTLDAIARRYSLSRSELMQANGLDNPNWLSINQQLKIPQTEPSGAARDRVTLLPGINSKPNSAASRQEQQGVTIPTVAISSTPSHPIAPVVPTVPLSQPRPAARPVLAESTTASSTPANSTVVVGAQPSQSNDAQRNPYVEKLRADILKLREDYQHQNESRQASTPRTVTVPTVTKPVGSSSNNSSTATRINPEFNPKRYNETLQAERERQRQQQQLQQGPIAIEVPPPERGLSASSRGLVAAAPAPADTYNPSLRTPVGETVSPELPSLSPPDMYLPGSTEQFNGYIWPTKGVLTSGYGWRWGRMHRGIDIAAPIGTPVVAAAPGVVVSAGWNSGGYGNLVEIQHPDGSLTLYAHNNRILVRRGQEVAQGQQISEMGSTGRSTGPHCHFEVHPSGRGAVNPIAYLPRR